MMRLTMTMMILTMRPYRVTAAREAEDRYAYTRR